jgi:hypothetical protein
MIEIRDEKRLVEMLSQKHALLFFHAPWSQYAVLSKLMTEFVEEYAKSDCPEVKFFFGEFYDELRSFS